MLTHTDIPRHRTLRFLSLLLIAALAMTACQTSDDQPTVQSPNATETVPTSLPVTPTPTTVAARPTPVETATPDTQTPQTLDDELNHLDLDAARSGLETARALWEQNRPDNYVVTVTTSCECSGFLIEAVVYGDAGGIGRFESETGGRSAGADHPRNADDIFARAERLLVALEADPSSAGDGECDGSHLYLRFDAVTGAPLHVSDNTPCDGGVGWNAKYEDLADLLEPIADRSDFDDVDFGEINPRPEAGRVLVHSRQFFTPLDVPVAVADVADFCSSFAVPSVCTDDAMVILNDLSQSLYSSDCVTCAETWVWVLVNRDNQTVVVQDRGELLELLGEIDTPTEVNLMALDEGPVRSTESGWEQLRHRNVLDCDPVIGRNSITVVTRDGTVYEPSRSFGIAEGVCL